MAHNIKLDALTMTDLQALIADAQAALAGKVDAERAELLKKLEALNAIAKPTKSTTAAPTRQRAAPKATHQSKKNPELTWSSRGAKPRWLVAEMDETGLPAEAFLIK